MCGELSSGDVIKAGKSLSDDFNYTADNIVTELEKNGFVCIKNAVSPEWLARARANVNNLIDTNGEKYFSIVRPADEAGSPANEIISDSRLVALLREITEAVCPEGVADYEEIYNVLRIIAGKNGGAGSLKFHFDASVLTALVPIFIPKSGRGSSGELVVFPNVRPFRKSIFANLAEKLIHQNRFAARFATRKVNANMNQHVRDLEPGNIYLFYGYRTYHANLACAPNSLRATMLLHYGNPHGDSSSLRMIRNGRRSIEALRRRVG